MKQRLANLEASGDVKVNILFKFKLLDYYLQYLLIKKKYLGYINDLLVI